MGVFRMKQVARVLSTYSADLFGINSVLYELGGLIVMHDASGCNSTYNTHDEPRWYDMESMVYISGLKENDVILGNDAKLIDDICRAAEETNPRFIAVTAALIPLFMSTDMQGIARIIEKRTGIPTFGFTTNAMDTYVAGGNMVYGELLRRFCSPQETARTRKRNADTECSVNLLGVTPLDFSVTGNVPALLRWARSHGFRVNCCMTMGCTLDEIARAREADVNLLCSSLAEDGARLLGERYGTPYLAGLPIGRYAADHLAEQLRTAADRPPQRNASSEDYAMRQRAEGGTWIIGEAIWANSLRCCLANDFSRENVHLLCPTERHAGQLRPGDVMTKEEEDIEQILSHADCVIADPIYRRILPPDWQKQGIHFVDFPHEAYSGRMYRSHIPVAFGEPFLPWLQERLREQQPLGINDIMKNNIPFARKGDL